MSGPGVFCVFARPPRPGEAKTRLIPAVGARGAARLARAFFEDTWATLQALPRVRLVLCTPGDPAAFGDLSPAPEIWSQGPGDLGQRMERMLRAALQQEAPWAICVGTDSPGAPPRLYRQPAAALQQHDAVLSPAEDGGYYLVGLRRCPRGLLADLPWSQPDTMQKTDERLRQLGLSVALGESWFDVDQPQDLRRLQRLLESGKVVAPATTRALESISWII